MMPTFLLWRTQDRPIHRSQLDQTATRLTGYFSPLLAEVPQTTVRQNGSVNLIALTTPVREWKRSFFEEDAETWVQAIDYPMDALSLLECKGVPFDHDHFLLTLCRGLETDPRSYLREMSPPFSLVWTNKRTAKTYVQIDGLGQAQLFEYDDGEIRALTNRIMSLKALGISLAPVPEEWAAYTALAGWFPLDMTGYRYVRRVPPATQYVISDQDTTAVSQDVLSEWLHPSVRSAQEWKEVARQSILRFIRSAARFWDYPRLGLSGGRDSRAIASSLRAAGVRFWPQVKGIDSSPDVTVASALAKIASWDLRHARSAELPSRRWEDWDKSICMAVQWQAGHMDLDKHKTFYVDGVTSLKAPRVNIMGQHGEIARAYLYKSSVLRMSPELLHSLDKAPYDSMLERLFVREQLKRLPPHLKPSLRSRTKEILTQAYRQTQQYGVAGFRYLDLFYLYEHTRRKNSASNATQANVVVTPFLNPDFIRATFSSSLEDRLTDALHTYIIETNSPDWAKVPYARNFVIERDEPIFETPTPSSSGKDFFKSTARASRYYDALRDWQTIGAPLLRAAISSSELLPQIFEMTDVEAAALATPDDLCVIYAVERMI